MTKKNLSVIMYISNMNMQSEIGLSQAKELLKKGDSDTARMVLEETLSNDLENKEIIFTLKCANYWNEKLVRISALLTPLERGETLIEQWKLFSAFIGETTFEQSFYAVKTGIFSLALDNYRQLLQEHGIAQKAEVYRKAGLCHKNLGDYDTALKFLNDANALVPEVPAVLAEMADCYALCGEERVAKVLFREAFFIDPQKIDISLLESELITRLVKRVEETGFEGAVLKEWIPVYGVLYGVFNIKRELRAFEIGKLKQTIFALENELKEVGNEPSLIIPRLINHYFWLIDYYVNTNDNSTAKISISEILLKIKLLDPSVHEKYIV